MANPNYDIDQPYAIHLFRSNLRIADNPSLTRCLEFNLPTLPLYCLNINEWERKWYVKESLGPFRKRFLIESLDDLDTTIRLKGGRLYVDEQDPISTLQSLYNSYCGLKVIVTTIEPDPPSNKVTSFQDEIEAFGREYGIQIIFVWDHTLIPFDALPDSYEDYNIPDSFKDFYNTLQSNGLFGPLPELPTPENIRAPSFPVRTLKDIKKIYPSLNYQSRDNMGGEFYATKNFNNYVNGLNQIQCIDDVYKPSYLSPWIANGSLSIRHTANTLFKFHNSISKELDDLEKYEPSSDETEIAQYNYLKQIKSAKVQRIKHFIAGLLWRDYFHFLYFKYQTHWYRLGGIQGKAPKAMNLNNLNTPEGEKNYYRWINGKTGYPFIDACIRCLKGSGYLAEKGRSNCAFVLVQILKIDWRLGAEFFEHYLIDHDFSSNIIQWQFVADVGHQKYTYKNTGKKDKNAGISVADAQMIRKWLPELSEVSDDHLFEPWLAASAVSYPEPVADKIVFPLVDLPFLS